MPDVRLLLVVMPWGNFHRFCFYKIIFLFFSWLVNFARRTTSMTCYNFPLSTFWMSLTFCVLVLYKFDSAKTTTISFSYLTRSLSVKFFSSQYLRTLINQRNYFNGLPGWRCWNCSWQNMHWVELIWNAFLQLHVVIFFHYIWSYVLIFRLVKRI